MLVLPFAMMLLIAGVNLATSSRMGLLALYSLGPAFASVAGSARRAVVVGATALALCMLTAAYNGMMGSSRQIAAMLAILGTTGASVLAGSVRRRIEHELSDVRSIAQTAQRVLLRPVPTLAGPMRIAVSYTSAAAAARIGGDLYEVAPPRTPRGRSSGTSRARGWRRWTPRRWWSAPSGRPRRTSSKLAEVGQRLERALGPAAGGRGVRHRRPGRHRRRTLRHPAELRPSRAAAAERRRHDRVRRTAADRRAARPGRTRPRPARPVLDLPASGGPTAAVHRRRHRGTRPRRRLLPARRTHRPPRPPGSGTGAGGRTPRPRGLRVRPADRRRRDAAPALPRPGHRPPAVSAFGDREAG
jgi:hypothetical protein